MGLAPRLVEEIFAMRARAASRRGTTIFLVDQNARAALAVADRGYVLETGRVVLAGHGRRSCSPTSRCSEAYLGHVEPAHLTWIKPASNPQW